MLVDLGRNDLGSVCDYGSVQVDELLQIERYSHVMHIVSNVVGRLRTEFDALDLFRAGFPAGTVTGTPKIRAMQLIDGLEPATRGFYAGSIGRWSFGGDFDSCITLRSVHVQNGHAWWQASAGIVADSDPVGRVRGSLSQNAHRPRSAWHPMIGRVLFVDNFDSFSYNVVHLLAAAGAQPDLLLNDDPRLAPVMLDQYEALVVGPGPGRPEHAPQMLEMLRAAMDRAMPVLGVCLGLQAIGEVLGATVTHAPRQMHGKTSRIEHDGTGLFAGLPTPLTATRYHSLCLDLSTIPQALNVTARSEDGVVQGIVHRELPVHAVQFHPESVLSEHGRAIVENFLRSTA